MTLATDLQNTAEEILQDFGFDAPLAKTGAATGDAWNPTYGADDVTTVRVFDYEEEIRDRSGQVTGVQRKLLVSTSAGVSPVKGDRVTLDGNEHRIDVVKKITLKGTVVVFDCVLTS